MRTLHLLARDRQARYIGDAGFTLIALFDGFVIISALDPGAPAWLIVRIGSAGVIDCRFIPARVQQRVAS
jgi:hypothetical protein